MMCYFWGLHRWLFFWLGEHTPHNMCIHNGDTQPSKMQEETFNCCYAVLKWPSVFEKCCDSKLAYFFPENVLIQTFDMFSAFMRFASGYILFLVTFYAVTQLFWHWDCALTHWHYTLSNLVLSDLGGRIHIMLSHQECQVQFSNPEFISTPTLVFVFVLTVIAFAHTSLLTTSYYCVGVFLIWIGSTTSTSVLP